MGKIPTVPFDANRHVIAVRETNEGREEWCTLGSLVDAERPLEAEYEATELDKIRSEIASLRQAQALPPDFERVIAEILAKNVPPPQLSQEVAAVLTDLTQAVLASRQREEALGKRLDVIENAMVGVAAKLGV